MQLHSNNTACTRTPAKYAGAGVVGLLLRSVRIFKQYAWLKVGFGKMALSRPTHLPLTPAVVQNERLGN